MNTCTSALSVTAVTGVTCALPDQHAQHSYPDGTENPQPARHIGTDGVTVYVWSNRDAGVMKTLRDAGFHDQCDHTARKLIIAESLRPAILALWQEAATSPDEPGNDELVRWVRYLIEHGDRDRRDLKDAYRRLEELRHPLAEPCPGGCGIDLGHPGNPDRQCACPKPAEPEATP